MIRINLLPFRTARLKENVRRQMSYILLSFLLTLAGLGWKMMVALFLAVIFSFILFFSYTLLNIAVINTYSF